MRNAKDLHGLAIVDVANGRKLGSADEIVVSPDSGRLLGFVMKSLGVLSPNERIIEMSDVRAIGADAITVEGNEVGVTGDAAAADLREARASKRGLNGKKVVTQDGTVVGTISDYTIDEHEARVKALMLGGGLFEKGDAIPADRIVSVGEDVVVVSEPGAGAGASGPRPFVA
jgi:sporulation protein YlmC with PRC-barrel domain